MSTDRQRHLDVYGLRIRIAGAWPEVVDAATLDFAWFEVSTSQAVDLEIVIERATPDYDAFGELTASFITPRNVVYQKGGTTIVDYFGKAVSVFDREAARVHFQSEDESLVRQSVYQFLLSRIGEHLDARGLPRFHALGLAAPHGAVAVMLPSGGGKTTLALRALVDDRVRLYSEDTPLIDRRGFLHPFPIRFGITGAQAETVAGATRQVRGGSSPKYALEVAAFADRVERVPRPLRHIVLGRRALGRSAALEPLPRRAAVSTLVREDVVGFGFFQGMEFLLRHGPRDAFKRIGITSNRALCCGRGLARSSVWSLTLGRDHDENWAALAPLLS